MIVLDNPTRRMGVAALIVALVSYFVIDITGFLSSLLHEISINDPATGHALAYMAIFLSVLRWSLLLLGWALFISGISLLIIPTPNTARLALLFGTALVLLCGIAIATSLGLALYAVFSPPLLDA